MGYLGTPPRYLPGLHRKNLIKRVSITYYKVQVHTPSAGAAQEVSPSGGREGEGRRCEGRKEREGEEGGERRGRVRAECGDGEGGVRRGTEGDGVREGSGSGRA